MRKQKSYAADAPPALYLVPTPIGNLQDMTLRAIEALKGADYVFAEDTRVTKVLLSHFNIMTTVYSYHAFNEETQSQKIIDFLRAGKTVALSDAGLPVSDPGYYVTRKALDEGFCVVAAPGRKCRSYGIGRFRLPSERFYFYGF